MSLSVFFSTSFAFWCYWRQLCAHSNIWGPAELWNLLTWTCNLHWRIFTFTWYLFPVSRVFWRFTVLQMTSSRELKPSNTLGFLQSCGVWIWGCSQNCSCGCWGVLVFKQSLVICWYSLFKCYCFVTVICTCTTSLSWGWLVVCYEADFNPVFSQMWLLGKAAIFCQNFYSIEQPYHLHE